MDFYKLGASKVTERGPSLIEVGGTNIKYARSNGLVLGEIGMVPTDKDRFIAQLSGLVLSQCDTGFRITTDVVIAVPGPVSVVDDTITAGPFPNITGEDETFDLHASLLEAEPELEDRLGRLIVLNDAEAAAHAVPQILTEEMGGMLPKKTLYVIHGTGVGGRLIKGAEPDDTLCEIGETVISLGPDRGEGKLENTVSGGAIATQTRYPAERLSRFDDPETEAFWDYIGSTFGYGLATFVPVLGPNLILIGGGVSRAFPRYGSALKDSFRSRLKKSNIGAASNVEVVQLPPTLVNTIGLLGCLAAYQKTYQA